MIKVTLITSISALVDERGIRPDVELWSEAIDKYITTINPDTETKEFAKNVFENTFLYAPADDILIRLSIALKAHANIIAAGMRGYMAIAPPTLPNFTPVSNLGCKGGTAAACADLMGTIIDSWYKLGTAKTLNNRLTINWK